MSAVTVEPAPSSLPALLIRQRVAFNANPYPSAADRRTALKRLRRGLRRHAQALADAARADFSTRPDAETLMLDVLPSLLHIDHLLRGLRRWMRPERRHTEWLFLGNRAWVEWQPKGVVGVLSPWNFPVYLAIGPLATALAAGNRCMIKTSEYAPRTSAALKSLLGECFEEDQVCVVEGDAEVAQAFSSLPFDHLVFTGSPAVGRHVMRAAAANLTPVTLELGGKSPAIVSRSADLAHAARKIAHGKVVNAGQICVAPDYALVPAGSEQAFADAVAAACAKFFPDGGARGCDYTAMIDDRSDARQAALIEDARSKGARIIVCPTPADGRRTPVQVVLGVTADMRLAQEEIFGPILPVLPYAEFDAAIAHVNRGDRPLALYYFGHDDRERAELMKRTHSGGVVLNDWGWHVANHDLPFGGVGVSGMGNYHGEEGFRELSHGRAMFTVQPWFPIHLFHPPYGGLLQRLLLWFTTGAAGARR